MTRFLATICSIVCILTLSHLSQIPEWPTEFIKGRSALANPDEPVPIPKYAQDTMDLEAEVRIPV